MSSYSFSCMLVSWRYDSFDAKSTISVVFVSNDMFYIHFIGNCCAHKTLFDTFSICCCCRCHCHCERSLCSLCIFHSFSSIFTFLFICFICTLGDGRTIHFNGWRMMKRKKKGKKKLYLSSRVTRFSSIFCSYYTFWFYLFDLFRCLSSICLVNILFIFSIILVFVVDAAAMLFELEVYRECSKSNTNSLKHDQHIRVRARACMRRKWLCILLADCYFPRCGDPAKIV